MSSYTLEHNGIYYTPDKKEGEASPEPMWLCSPLHMLALTKDENDRWGKLLIWTDADGKEVKWNMPDRLLSEKDKLWQALRDRGLLMTTNPALQSLLLAYLNTRAIEKRAHVVQRLGWFDKDDGDLSFVLPDRVIGNTKNIYYDGDVCAYKELGTLEEWQANVAKLALGNTRAAFAMCVPFASPLLYLLDEPSGGFNLFGETQIGKTTDTDMGNSVTGYESLTWRATDNGLEAKAEQRCDGVIYLDEMGQVDSSVAGKIAYMIANGQGKARAHVTGDARKNKHWRVMLLSSGEVTLADKMNEAGHTRHGGQETRIVDIPADAGAGYGTFENLHGFKNGRDFSKTITRHVHEYRGTAFIAYLQQLVELVKDQNLISALRDECRQFVDRFCPANTAPQVGSVCARFAMVAVAGELATKMGVTGWPEGEATRAAQTCFNAWLDHRGHHGTTDMEEAINKIVAAIEKYGVSQFQEIGVVDIDHITVPNFKRLGYRKWDHQLPRPEDLGGLTNFLMDESTAPIDKHRMCWRYYILPQAFKDLLKGYNPTAVAKEMHRRGLILKLEAGRYTSKVRAGGDGHPRCYCLAPGFLDLV